MKRPPRLVIGDKNYSSWSLRPWLLLRQRGIEFDEVRLPLDTPEFAQTISRWSPTGRVPVLLDGDVHVWDSLAICEYVSERWLRGRGWPSDRYERAIARAISAEMHSGFAALRTAMPMNCRKFYPGFKIPKDAQRDLERVCQLWRDCRRRNARHGDFLFGKFSIADAMYAPVILRFVSYDIDLAPIERDYSDAMRALPAMIEWIEAANAETHVLPTHDHVI